MRKIVDSNYLQSPDLKKYLSKSEDNFVVLTDFLAMETYKSNDFAEISAAMETLTQFPEQIIVLKETHIVCGLKGRKSGLQKRLIDDTQTEEFADFCADFIAAKDGDEQLQGAIQDHGQEAKAQMESTLADVESLPEAITEIDDIFSAAETDILRQDRDITDDMVDKLIENVLLLAAKLLRDHPRATNLPDAAELPNTFLFRVALCTHLRAISQITAGGPEGERPQQTRDDIVDIYFAAYATFFDGLLTADKILDDTCRLAAHLLPVLFSGETKH